MKEGYGIFRSTDGTMYKGFWLKGKKHGEGQISDKFGNVRRGVWNNGELSEIN